MSRSPIGDPVKQAPILPMIFGVPDQEVLALLNSMLRVVSSPMSVHSQRSSRIVPSAVIPPSRMPEAEPMDAIAAPNLGVNSLS